MVFPMAEGTKKSMKALEKPSCEISYHLEETQNLILTRREEEGVLRALLPLAKGCPLLSSDVKQF